MLCWILGFLRGSPDITSAFPASLHPTVFPQQVYIFITVGVAPLESTDVKMSTLCLMTRRDLKTFSWLPWDVSFGNYLVLDLCLAAFSRFQNNIPEEYSVCRLSPPFFPFLSPSSFCPFHVLSGSGVRMSSNPSSTTC